MREFFRKIGYGFQRFMEGRYGNDKLNFVLLIAALFVELIYMFVPFWPLSLLSLVLIAVEIFRTFSKNIPKRYAENQKLEKFLGELKMRKNYHIYKCPSCRQKIRIPRKGGKKVEIRCPKCAATFIKTI